MGNEVMRAGWLDLGDKPLPLVGKTFSLGRARDNNVVFTSAKVSRRHALVHAQGGAEFSLVDLGSSNGTHLNGRRVIQPVMLQHGDVIQIGEESLTFRLEAPLAPAEPSVHTDAEMTEREAAELTCWFLVLDIENFVQLTRDTSTEELAQMVGSWVGQCQRAIESDGGTVSKFLGDGLLAYWDARFADSPNVVSTIQQLRELQARPSPPFRWALHFGNAAFGTAIAPGEVSALGHDLNLLFRLERIAAEHQFPSILSGKVHAQIGDRLGSRLLGSFPIKGLEGQHQLYGC